MTQQQHDPKLIEAAARAHYEYFFDGVIYCCEPAWNEVEPRRKRLLLNAMAVALTAAQQRIAELEEAFSWRIADLELQLEASQAALAERLEARNVAERRVAELEAALVDLRKYGCTSEEERDAVRTYQVRREHW
jgi:hypothetical protein